jgi:HK97 family phage portal protein
MWPFSRKTEQRDWASTWLSFGDLLGATTASGIRVTQTNAIEHPAVYRCVDLNSQTIGSFPVDCKARRGENRVAYPDPEWIRHPNDYQDFNGLVAEQQASQELYDSAFLLKASAGNKVVGLSVLDPNAVEMKWLALDDGRRVIVYDVQLVTGKVRLAYNEILHIKAGLPIPGALRGISPTVAARETIGTGMAARQFGANFFGTGATLSGVIETPNQMTQEQAERLQEAFKKRHGGVSKSHAVGILAGGAQWKPLSVAPNESQHLETQKYTDATIAALFGIPAEYVSPGGMEGAKGYVTGLYQRQMLWYQTGLFSRITRNERAFSSLLPRPAYIKFNVNSWLRMDPEQRVAFYAAGQQGEWLSRNDIRAYEDMNPLEDGDEMLHSVQWQENAPEPEPEPEQQLVLTPAVPPEEAPQ